MIKIITGLAANVVGFEAQGKVTADDYSNVLVPAVETAIEFGGRARLLYVLGEEFKSFELGAMWADAKVGMGHLSDFEQIAVVTDLGWIEQSVRAFGVIIPCPVKVFSCAELESAKKWINKPKSRALDIDVETVEGTAYVNARLSGALGRSEEKELVDTVTAATADADKIRLLIEARDFHGWNDVRALWMHMKFVAGKVSKIERIAIVGDATWQRRLIATANHVLRVDARFFAEPDVAQARSWIRE
jgi:hypothetical protein